jgi:hypothetical protein
MSILIEQDSAALSASASFHQRAELNVVCLVSARVQRHLDWSALEQPIQLEFKFEPRDATVGDGEADIRTYFQFRALDSPKSDLTKAPLEALLVECTFQATYDLHPDYVPEPSELVAFQAGNAIFNAWPYFREFVQNNVARMNLPIPPVPFLRVGLRADAGGEKQAAPAPQETLTRKRRSKK